MLYIIETEAQRGGFLKELLLMKFSKENPLRITVDHGHPPKKRSLNQNDLAHQWFRIIADETGNDLETVKATLKDLFISKKVATIGNATRLISPGTSALTTEEMSKFMDRVQAFAATELGLTLPSPEDLQHVP